MIVSINQPAYLPWPGYFDRILKSDIFVSLDHVQFEKNSLTNRNKIKTPQGWMWLTIPVQTKGKFGKCAITDIKTNHSIRWQHKQWQAILSNYNKSPFFSNYSDYFKNIYEQEWPLLNDLITEINTFLFSELKIETKIIKSSDMKLQQTKSNLVLEICKYLNAKTYLSGPLGRDYLDTNSFNDAGIKVLYHDYQYPTYPQLYDDFQPYMSIIDMLFNCGAEDTRERLQNIQKSPTQVKIGETI